MYNATDGEYFIPKIIDICHNVIFFKHAGKSLYIKRLYEKLKHSTKKSSMMKCIRLIEPNVDENVILQSLLDTPKRKELMMFHFDITSSVIISS